MARRKLRHRTPSSLAPELDPTPGLLHPYASHATSEHGAEPAVPAAEQSHAKRRLLKVRTLGKGAVIATLNRHSMSWRTDEEAACGAAAQTARKSWLGD